MIPTEDGVEAPRVSGIGMEDLPDLVAHAGRRMVVVLTGRATSGLDHQALITDLLPAGFEAEIASLASARQTGDYSWLPALTTPLYAEYRDDRFVAAFDVYDENSDSRDFTFAYLVRAVTPGDYKVPAPSIEDMYKPNYRGRGVGAALMRAAEEWGRASQCTELGSDTQLWNESSIAAHKALGFEEVERLVAFRKSL